MASFFRTSVCSNSNSVLCITCACFSCRTVMQDDMLPWLRDVTGFPLNDRVDMFCSIYEYTGKSAARRIGGDGQQRFVCHHVVVGDQHKWTLFQKSALLRLILSSSVTVFVGFAQGSFVCVFVLLPLPNIVRMYCECDDWIWWCFFLHSSDWWFQIDVLFIYFGLMFHSFIYSFMNNNNNNNKCTLVSQVIPRHLQTHKECKLTLMYIRKLNLRRLILTWGVKSLLFRSSPASSWLGK